MTRYLRPALLVAGVLALVVLVMENDPAAIAGSLAQLSWQFAILLSFHTVVAIADALGWRFAFAASADPVPFVRLLMVRLAGEAVNLTTPTASVGGEAVKAWMLRDHAPVEETLPSVIVAKTTITVAQGLFLVLGVIVAARVLPLHSPLLQGMVWLLVAEVVALSIFVVAQMRGLLGGVARLVSFLGLPASAHRHDVLFRANTALERFYRQEPGRFLLSTAFHLVGWLLGVAETFLILYFLGVDPSLSTAILVEALATGIRFVVFFIPAGLGAMEGGLLVAFGALGLAPTVALSFSLVRRLREAGWIGIGLIALIVIRQRAPLVVEPPVPS